MPNWGGGLSGAASGAAMGSAIPVIGTGIGALAGGLFGLFGGGGNKKPEQPAAPQIDWMQRSQAYNAANPLYQPGSAPDAPTRSINQQDYNWGGFQTPNFGQINRYKGNDLTADPRILDNLRAVTDMSNALGGGARAYQQALGTYSRLSSGDRGLTNTFLAPERAAIDEATKGAMSQLQRTPGMSAATRGTQMAETARQGAGQLGLLAPTLMKDATAQMGTLGLEGAKNQGSLALGAASAAGDYMNQIHGMNTQRAIAAGQLEQGNRQIGANLLQSQAQLGFNYANANLGAMLQHDEQDFNAWIQESLFGMQGAEDKWKREFYVPYSIDQEQQNRNLQADAANKSMWGSVIGGGLGALGQLGGAYLANRGGGSSSPSFAPSGPYGS